MPVGTLSSDAGNLWPLAVIAAACFFIWLFRAEIKELLPRMRSLDASRGDTKIGATFDPQHPSLPSGAGGAAQAVAPEGESQTPAEATDAELEPADEPPSSEAGAREAMFAAAKEEDWDGAERALAEFERLTDDKEARETERLRLLALRANFGGDKNALQKLQAAAPQHQDGQFLRERLLGLTYSRAGEHRRAAEAFQAAASLSKSPTTAAELLVEAAADLRQAGNAAAGLDLLHEELSTASTDEVKAVIWTGIADLHQGEGSIASAVVALEAALQAAPTDVSLHFRLAYQHSAEERAGRPLSIHHYETLLGFQPEHDPALNNLGVQYEHKDLPILSIERYRAAAEHGSTLAMANIAYRFAGAGFVDEAQEVVAEAERDDDPHENVASAKASIPASKSAEIKKSGALRKKGRDQADLLRELAAKQLVELPAPLEGEWVAGKDVAEIAVTGDSVVLEWTHLGKRRKFTGTLRNSVAEGTFHKMEYSFVTDEERGFKEEGQGFLLVRSAQELSLVEYPDLELTTYARAPTSAGGGAAD